MDSLQSDSAHAEAERRKRIAGIEQRLAALRARMDQMYEDKLDGKVDAEFWTRKTNDWREQERKLETDLSSLRVQVPAENALTVKRIFELENKAHFLSLTRNSMDRGQLLKSVLLNCDTDGVSFAPTYRKPFDLIFERAKNEDWSGREDLNLRPPGPEHRANALTRHRLPSKFGPLDPLGWTPLLDPGSSGLCVVLPTRVQLAFRWLPTRC